VALVAASARCLFAQAAAIADAGVPVQVTAPRLGHFFEPVRKELRSIGGIPGSGFVGEAIPSAAGAALVEISPAQDFALAVLRSGELARIVFDSDAPAAVPVAGAMDAISLIAISPSGSAALVYSASKRRAQVFAPVLTREWDWSALPGDITAAAVNDAGDSALVAAQTDAALLYAVSDGVAPAAIYSARSISSVAFLRNSREALVAAPADKQVIWVRDNHGVPNATVLADERGGWLAPRIVAASADGAQAFAVDGASDIVAIPLSGAPVTRISCDCSVSQLSRLRGIDAFLVNATGSIDTVVMQAAERRQ
jgi:hypothetical protein